MKNPTLFLSLLISLFLTNACKKGEDDPKISLLSRKARVVGHWNMTQGTASFTSIHGTAVNDYYIFDGSKFTLNETASGPDLVVYYGYYTLAFEFKKDGVFTATETISSSSLTARGTWNFTSGVGKAKNKDGILLHITSITGDATDRHIFNQTTTEFSYHLKELKSKEMVLVGNSDIYLNSNGNSLSYSSEYTLKGNGK